MDALKLKDPSIEEQLTKLVDDLLFIDALALLQTIPLEIQTSKPEFLILRGKILSTFDEVKPAAYAFLKSFRKFPSHEPALAYYIYATWLRQGYFAALQKLEKHPYPVTHPRFDSLELLKVDIYTRIRGLAQAKAVYDKAYPHLSEAGRLRIAADLDLEEHKFREAEPKVLELLKHDSLDPRTIKMHLQVQWGLNQTSRVETLLNDVATNYQVPYLESYLLDLYAKQGRWQEAREFVDKFREKYGATKLPAFEKSFEKRLHVLDKLAQSTSSHVVGIDGSSAQAIPVPFIYQDRDTCVPSSVGMILKYLGVEFDDVKAAREMVFGGTPDHKLFSYLKSKNIYCRRFTLTPEVVTALIAKKIPFGVTIRNADFAHMMVAVGFSEEANVLFVVDPSDPWRTMMPFDTDKDLGYQLHAGYLLLPQSRVQDVADIELPEADLHAALVQLSEGLYRKNTVMVDAAVRTLEPYSTRIDCLESMMLLHFEKAEYEEAEAIIDRILAVDPKHSMALRNKNYTMISLGKPNSKRMEFVNANAKDDRYFAFEQMAETMRGQITEAVRSGLRMDLRNMAGNSNVLLSYANYLQNQYRYAEAQNLRDLALILDDHGDHTASSWTAYQRRFQFSLALDFGRARIQKYSVSEPKVILAFADQFGETLGVEVNRLVDEAIKRDPNIWDLRQARIRAFIRRGQINEAQQELESCPELGFEHQRQMIQAEIFECQARFNEARAMYAAILARTPHQFHVYDAVARLIERTKGVESAFHYIRRCSDTYPHYDYLKFSALGYVSPEDRRAYLEEILSTMHSKDDQAYCLRDLAYLELKKRNLSAAMTYLEGALEKLPFDSHLCDIRLQMIDYVKDPNAAFEFLEPKIQMLRDQGDMMSQYFDLAQKTQRLDSAFAEKYLMEYLDAPGSGQLFEFYLNHWSKMNPDGDRQVWWDLFTSRYPKNWYAQSQQFSQALKQSRHEDAEKILREIKADAGRSGGFFALSIDLARHQNNAQREEELLKEWAETHPAQLYATDRYAGHLSDQQRYIEAAEVYKKAQKFWPANPYLFACVHNNLWRADRKKESLEFLVKSALTHYSYDWSWENLLDRFEEVYGEEEGRAKILALADDNKDPTCTYRFARIFVDTAPEIALKYTENVELENTELQKELIGLRIRALMKLNRSDDAQAYLQKIKNRRHRLEATVIFADLLGDSGWVVKKLNLTRLAEDFQDQDAMWFLAERAEEAGDYDQMRHFCQLIVAQDPASSVAFNWIGHSYLHQKKYGESLEYFYSSLDLDPANESSIAAIFDTYFEHEPSEENYKKAFDFIMRQGLESSFYSLVRQLKVANHFKDDGLILSRIQALATFGFGNDWARETSLRILKERNLVEKAKGLLSGNILEYGQSAQMFYLDLLEGEPDNKVFFKTQEIFGKHVKNQEDTSFCGHFFDKIHSDRGKMVEEISAFIDTFGPEIKANPSLRDRPTYTFVNHCMYQHCVDWMEGADLKSTSDSVLHNLGVSYFYLSKVEEGMHVLSHLSPDSDNDSRILSALVHTCGGDLGVAKELSELLSQKQEQIFYENARLAIRVLIPSYDGKTSGLALALQFRAWQNRFDYFKIRVSPLYKNVSNRLQANSKSFRTWFMVFDICEDILSGRWVRKVFKTKVS